MNLPNTITLARFILALVMFALMAVGTPTAFAIALGVFLVAALSDLLDGYLARRYNMITEAGRAADPFVDKILVLGALVHLIPHYRYSCVAPWMVLVVMVREIMVLGVRTVAESQGVPFVSDCLGKIKMVLQSVAISVSMLAVAAELDLGGYLCGLLCVTVAVTAVSGVEYLVRARTVLQTSDHA